MSLRNEVKKRVAYVEDVDVFEVVGVFAGEENQQRHDQGCKA